MLVAGKTVREFVLEVPNATRVFDRLGTDQELEDKVRARAGWGEAD